MYMTVYPKKTVCCFKFIIYDIIHILTLKKKMMSNISLLALRERKIKDRVKAKTTKKNQVIMHMSSFEHYGRVSYNRLPVAYSESLFLTARADPPFLIYH